jgi:NADPH2:quinone reductase
MQAWRVHDYGPFRDVLKQETIDPPEVSDDTAIMEVHAAGVMFADLLSIAGQYQVKMPTPFVPGSEAAGVIVEAGKDSRFAVGDRVMAMQLAGAFGERMIVLNSMSFPIPEDMSYAHAAALTVNYQTAYFALKLRARLQPGETLLVHGGAGGVGTAAIQIGKALGANVIATGSTKTKLDICSQCGADHLINYKDEGFIKPVKALTDGRGADVIFDPVGGSVFNDSTRCIAFGGRLVVIGFASGTIPELAVNRLLVKNFDAIGLYWGNYQFQQPQLILDAQEELYKMYAAGSIKPIIYEEYDFDRLPDALDALHQRQSHGKVILAKTS